ncbi:hypothetical protein BH11MYX1_BH11MYX1_03470 [soil metagenome]
MDTRTERWRAVSTLAAALVALATGCAVEPGSDSDSASSALAGRVLQFGARVMSARGESPGELRRDFASAQADLGPLTSTRAFQVTLPPNQSERVSPSADIEITSYKTQHSSTLAAFVKSMEPQDMLAFYHEPEGPDDWASGAAYVAAFEAECRAAHRARPDVKFGMIAGGYQYHVGKRGYSGSYLPTNCIDFYAFDTYRDGSRETGSGSIEPLADVAEFQRWYSLVKDRGKPLLVTEYGRGTVGNGELASTPHKRAQVIPQDAAWLRSKKFVIWNLWYSDFGPDGRAWRFTDQASIDAWQNAAQGN